MAGVAGLAAGPGWRFRLAGVPVNVPLNTLLGVGLIAWLWAPLFAGGQAPWLVAIGFAVLLLASVLVHEFAHAAAARRFGYPVEGITLWAFGGFTSYRPLRESPARAAAVAAAGPLTTLLVAGAAFAAAQLVGGIAQDLLLALAVANAFMGVFNLLPGIPLDGGAIVSAAVWGATGSRPRGQLWAARTGIALAALVALSPFAAVLRDGRPPTLFGIALGLLLGGFLFVGARSAMRSAQAGLRLADARAGDLALPVVALPNTATVADLDTQLAGPAAPALALVVDADGQIRAAVDPGALQQVPAQARAGTPIGAVSAPIPLLRVVPADMPASAIAADPALQPPLLVSDAGGRTVGIIPADAFAR